MPTSEGHHPHEKRIIWTLLFLVLIDLIGVGIVIPILPELFFTNVFFGAGVSQATRGILMGLLIAAYPLAQFFGAPLIGALSDKHGRKKLLALSIIGTVLGYILFAIGIIKGNLPLLFASRILDGFTGGNISIVRSSIADISSQANKTKNFGLIGMAFGVGFIIGPFLGGKLADPSVISWFTLATPFWFAAILAAVNLILILIIFEETLKHPRHRPLSMLTGLRDIKKGFSRKDLRGIYLSSFLVFFGWSFFTQFFQVYLYETFKFTPGDIGNLFAYIGLWMIITQGTIVRYFAKYRHERVLRVSLLGLVLALLILLIPRQVWLLYVADTFTPIFFGFTMPFFSTILSDAVSKEEQGEVLGIQQSMFSLAQAVPPLIAGVSLAFASWWPIVIGAFFILLGWLFVPRHIEHKRGTES